MSESTPQTPTPAGEPKAAEQGVSLYADAWRRLRKNKMAMISVFAITGMAVICTLANPISAVVGVGPTYGFRWIRAQSPGFTHPDTKNITGLIVGSQPNVRERYQGAKELTFETIKREISEYRLAWRRNKVKSISMTLGAKPVDDLSIEGQDVWWQVIDADGKPLGEKIYDAQLAKKAALPAAFGERERSGVIVFRQIREIPDGVQTISVKLDGGAITSLLNNSEPIDEIEIEGRIVKRVLADGVEQTITHPLGTDLSGRDLFVRILYGGQISLLVGLVATFVSLLIGVVYGAVSGYAGGRIDAFMMAVVDILYGIPYMFLVILLLVNFGRSIVMLFFALGAVQWLTMARIVRGQVLSLKQKEFVEAARMSGSSPSAIMFKHLIPNTLGIVVVYTTLTVPAVILQESFLAFIGLTVEWGGQSLDSWGALVKSGSDAGLPRSWLLIWPSLAMAVTLFGMNFLGDGLRDAFDPQQRGRT